MQTANPESASLKLLVLGFNETERRLLQAIVKLSQRRTPALHLLEADEGPDNYQIGRASCRERV